MKTPEDEAFEELERRTRPVKQPQDEIIRMAVECQLLTTSNRDGLYAQALEAFAKLVAEKERETCAKVCEETDDGTPYNLAEECARNIRARGDNK
jgi:hypothetical protein